MNSLTATNGRAPTQPDLFAPKKGHPPLPTIDPDNANVTMLVGLLTDRTDWITSAQLLLELGKPVTDNTKRWVRALADASRGRIAGGQKGYKLVRAMTNTEYQHWRNWMTHQSDEMKRRVIEADRVFFAHNQVKVM